jgi:hypothetical protein
VNIRADLIRVAKRVVWLKPPEETLKDPVFFLTNVMARAKTADIAVVQRYFTEEEFRRALENAPPGVFGPKGWAKWNAKFGRVAVPPLPKRSFLSEEEAEVSRTLGRAQGWIAE